MFIRYSLIAIAALASWCIGAQVDLAPVALGLTAPKYPIAAATGSYADDGSYTLQGKGHGFYWGWDRGAFAYTQVSSASDWTFTARIKKDPTGCVAGQWGVGVREGLVGSERTVSARYDEYAGNACITWFYRMIPADISSEFCADGQRFTCFKEGKAAELTSRTGTWLRIKCTARKYSLFTSTDGSTWTSLGAEQTMILGTQNIYVGLIFSCGNQGTPSSSAQFDNISLTISSTGAAARTRSTPSGSISVQAGKNGLHSLTLPASLRSKALSLELYAMSGQRVACFSPAGVENAGTVAFRLPGGIPSGMYQIAAVSGSKARLAAAIMIP